MSNYTFTFKKDDILVEFSTTDKDVVANQFRLWVDDAEEYSKTHKPKSADEKKNLNTVEIFKTAEKAFNRNAEKEPVTSSISNASVASKQNLAETRKMEQGFANSEQKPVTINSLQNQSGQVAEHFDATQAVAAASFDSVLEQKIENNEPQMPKEIDTQFVNYVASKNTTDKMHLLLITAFYLLQNSKFEKFSLKLINSKLMHNLSELLDHSVLQEALNNGFIEIIPNISGENNISEYKLTENGERFVVNDLSGQ